MTPPVAVLKSKKTEVAAALAAYTALFDESGGGDLEARKRAYTLMANHFYDLVTDFYQFGWGDSFHFAPRRRGESLLQSLARCEQFFARQMELTAGCKALDLGCGVGGPLAEIARFSGAGVIGINNNAYQVTKVERKLARLGLDKRCSVIKGDFMKIPVAVATFDAAYSLEATPHAPDKLAVYREIFRVLKPGGLFVGDEWCLTDIFRANDSTHRRLKQGIEIGNALPELATTGAVVNALKMAGFEVLVARDAAVDSDLETPWYRALQGRDLTFLNLPRTPAGRAVTNTVVKLCERLRIFPRGTAAVSTLLNHAADDLVAAGIAGIFTPLFFFKARKP